MSLKPICDECPIKDRDYQLLVSKAEAYDRINRDRAEFKAIVWDNLTYAAEQFILKCAIGEDPKIKSKLLALSHHLKRHLEEMPHKEEFDHALAMLKKEIE